MQSIILKFAKILVLGGPKNALHGVTKLPLYLFLIIIISGCSCFSDSRIAIKPKIDTNSPRYKEMLSMIIGNRYDSEFLRIISADKAYQEYLIEKKTQDNGSDPL